MSFDPDPHIVTGSNNPRKQVSVTRWNEFVNALAAAISAAGGEWGSLTGTLSDQTDLQAALDAKADDGHGHAIADTSGLQAELDSKADDAATTTALAAKLAASSNLSDLANTAAARSNLGVYSTAQVDAAVAAATPTESIIIACSDETSAITTGTAKVSFRMPYAFTLTAVRASVTTAPTGSTIVIDINEGGSTILSTKLSIDASEKTSTTAATPAVISDSVLADDSELTIDFDQVGSMVAGAGVKVYLIGHR